MKCDRIRELVSDALDGVLPDSVADRFHAHLDDCPPCRTYHAELRESLLLLEELPTVEVTDEFDREVWARIRQEEPSSWMDAVRENLEMLRVRFSIGMGVLRWSPAAVAALLLLGIAATSPPKFVASTGEAPEVEAGNRTAVALSGSENGASRARIADPAAEPVSASRWSERDASVDGAGTEEAEFAEFESEMPQAVKAFLASGRDLRLTNSDRYEMSNYSYPLRRIADPVRRGLVPGVRFSPRSAGAPGTPVGTAVPTGRSASEPAVAVFEF